MKLKLDSKPSTLSIHIKDILVNTMMRSFVYKE